VVSSVGESRPLQHAARLDRQIIQRHLQLRNGGADFRMLSDLLLQRLENLVGTFDVGLCSGRIWFGIAFAL
jgi:hypothetical protein